MLELVVGNTQYYVDNTSRTVNPAPTMSTTGAILVSEEMLASLGINATPTSGNNYSIVFGTKKLDVVVGSKNASLDTQAVTLDEAPTLSGGKLIVPIQTIVRLLTDVTMRKLEWNDAARRLTVTIYQ